MVPAPKVLASRLVASLSLPPSQGLVLKTLDYTFLLRFERVPGYILLVVQNNFFKKLTHLRKTRPFANMN